MADRVLHLGRWKLIYTGRKEVKRRRRREVGKIVGSGEERERERESWYLRWRLCVCIDALWGPWYQRGRLYNEPYTVYSV